MFEKRRSHGYNMIAFLSLFQHSSASSNWSTRKQSIICPVSVALNATSNGIFSYPTFNREIKLPSPLTCTALSDYGPEEIQCLSTGGCPLSQLNTESFSKCSSKNSYYNLCQVLTTLKEDCLHGETVRLIVFGGSVASGHSTCGCCGRSIPSNDCPFSDVISSRNYSDEDATMNYCSYAVKNHVNLDSEYCNWSAFLDRWLRSIAPQCRIRYHNIAYSGMSSKIMAEKVESTLRQDYNISQLNATDLVLLDYSYNDAAEDSIGMEDLIRVLLSMSVADAEPAIVILETRKIVPHKAMRAYREVAEHYSVPLWSYRDFIHQNMIENRTNYEQLLQVYTLRDHALFNIHEIGWHHPAWPVHLLWADLIAGGLLSAAQNCSDWNPSPGVGVSVGVGVGGREGAAAQSLPSRLKPGRILSCNLRPSLLDASADMIASSINEEDPTRVWSSSTWNVGADGPHKTVGWISTLPGEAAIEHSPHGSHKQVITFQPHLAAGTTDFSSNSSTSILVGIDYLKTYLNAGVVDILWCDMLLGSIDSLRGDGDGGMRVSVHDFAKFRTTLVPSHATGRREEHCKLRITHGRVAYGNLTARGTSQKFKLFSIQICIIPSEL